MMHLGTRELNTERLTLRKFNHDDFHQFYINVAGDDKVTRFLSWKTHASEDETKEVIGAWRETYKNDDVYNWVVEITETKEVIGNISVVKNSNENRTCEIGYDYGSKYWGNGFATEALHEVCRYLLKEVGYRIIECYYVSGNPASGGVMEKAGMKRDGILGGRRIDSATGEVYDLICYSILQNEI